MRRVFWLALLGDPCSIPIVFLRRYASEMCDKVEFSEIPLGLRMGVTRSPPAVVCTNRTRDGEKPLNKGSLS